MSVAMWNCHSWPLDVSSNVKLPKQVHLPEKVGLSAKFCVPRGYIGQSRFVCQVFCTGGSISQRRFICQKSRFICQVLCIWGVHWQKKVHLLEKVGLSAKFCVPRGSAIGRRRFVCQIWAHLQFYALLHRRSFRITYKRPNNLFKHLNLAEKNWNHMGFKSMSLTFCVSALTL